MAEVASARSNAGRDHPLEAALAAQGQFWPDVPTGIGALEPGWTTAEAFFGDEAAIAEFLAYEGSFNLGTDRKTCAAFLMTDYAYILSIATVPAFVGFGLLPELAPSRIALRFYQGRTEHDGQIHEVRRAHVRYLSPAFSTGSDGAAAHRDTRGLVHHDGLRELFRLSLEGHFRPLIEVLSVRTGLSRNALWRLAADAIAGRFLDAGRRFNRLEEAKASAMALLKQQGSPFANKQLHYFDLTVLDRERKAFSYTFRARGGCCRFYTVEGGELCETCVLKNPQERDDELRRLMRNRLGLPSEGMA